MTIQELVHNPDQLLLKKPFTRGALTDVSPFNSNIGTDLTEKRSVSYPRFKRKVVRQEQYLRELDPYCHDVLFDENIPSFCVKMNDGNYYDVKYKKVALPIQQLIKDKQVLHLCANKMQFTLIETNPDEKTQENFITFRQYWDLRNQDGMKTKMVDGQKSYGDAGLLYYFNSEGEIKSRLLTIEQGFVLIPHNDKNGDRILESVYYMVDDVEYIDSYDKKYMYRCTRGIESEGDDNNGWIFETPVEHGFEEIPLVTKRGSVAWDNVQTQIEGLEVLYNIFLIVQKRYGNGILYVKGKFKDKAQKIAGSVVLNDTSMDGNGDAKFLTPPTPQNMLDTMQGQLDYIMLGSKTTFVLPKDIQANGDVSGLAVQLTRELDILNAEQAVIDWQNVADKMTRLFKYGLAIELVNKGINTEAINEFERMRINAKFKVWRPFNENEYNSMIIQLNGAGLISKETGIELNTMSKPDEKARIEKEKQDAIEENIVVTQNQEMNTHNNDNDVKDTNVE